MIKRRSYSAGFVAGRVPIEHQGMTLLELLLAVLMLVVFTSVVVMVMEFTFRFLGEAESGDNNDLEVSNGVLIDHQEIHLAMDQLVEMSSQESPNHVSMAMSQGSHRWPSLLMWPLRRPAFLQILPVSGGHRSQALRHRVTGFVCGKHLLPSRQWRI